MWVVIVVLDIGVHNHVIMIDLDFFNYHFSEIISLDIVDFEVEIEIL